jgi:hypothetical protein
LANVKIDASLVTQQGEVERVGLATRAVITEYTGKTSKIQPAFSGFNPNGQRDEKMAQRAVKVSNSDRVNRKGLRIDSVEFNETQTHDKYALTLGGLMGNLVHAFMDKDNAMSAGMDKAMVERDTFEGIVTRNQTYWGTIPRAQVDKIPLLQWAKDDKYGAVLSLSPAGIKWVDDVLKPDPIALQWERVLDTPKEPKESAPSFKYACLCEINGKPRKMTIPFPINSTCHDCNTVWELVTA